MSRLATNFFSRPYLCKQSSTFFSCSRRFYSDLQTKFETQGEKMLFDKLFTKLNPTLLKVTDTSSGCGAMYLVQIQSPQFKGLGILKQHRLINEILKEEIAEMHGLRIMSSASE
ncbi:hypothetical protein BB560_001801 [Smittium megazygosporum]|uniref:BolA protein n=1 Tax=Smittium megazygosporum TaxID=133381 RepID=A0A2T9ZGL8_9FUNG|nr:hypothetical protein BB560_001801 [Smittium megazygosporum]